MVSRWPRQQGKTHFYSNIADHMRQMANVDYSSIERRLLQYCHDDVELTDLLGQRLPKPLTATAEAEQRYKEREASKHWALGLGYGTHMHDQLERMVIERQPYVYRWAARLDPRTSDLERHMDSLVVGDLVTHIEMPAWLKANTPGQVKRRSKRRRAKKPHRKTHVRKT